MPLLKRALVDQALLVEKEEEETKSYEGKRTLFMMPKREL